MIWAHAFLQSTQLSDVVFRERRLSLGKAIDYSVSLTSGEIVSLGLITINAIKSDQCFHAHVMYIRLTCFYHRYNNNITGIYETRHHLPVIESIRKRFWVESVNEILQVLRTQLAETIDVVFHLRGRDFLQGALQVKKEDEHKGMPSERLRESYMRQTRESVRRNVLQRSASRIVEKMTGKLLPRGGIPKQAKQCYSDRFAYPCSHRMSCNFRCASPVGIAVERG